VRSGRWFAGKERSGRFRSCGAIGGGRSLFRGGEVVFPLEVRGKCNGVMASLGA